MSRDGKAGSGGLGAVALLVVLLAGGCDDSFDPFLEGDALFALYGVLDTRQDTQLVRTDPLAMPAAAASAVRFTSTDLTTNETVVWADTLLTLEDGTTALAFYAPLAVRPGHTYRLTVVYADGPATATTAELTVPPEAEVEVFEPVEIGGFILNQRVVLEGLEAPPLAAEVRYGLQFVGAAEPDTLAFDYTPAPVPEGQRIVVDLVRDGFRIRRRFDVAVGDSTSIALLGLGLRYVLFDEAPGAIANGVGDVDAVGAYEAAWTLPPEAVERLGFVDAQGR